MLVQLMPTNLRCAWRGTSGIKYKVSDSVRVVICITISHTMVAHIYDMNVHHDILYSITFYRGKS